MLNRGRQQHQRRHTDTSDSSEVMTPPPPPMDGSADEGTGGTVGELETNCSEKEVLDRQQTRQIDKFERAVEDYEGRPKANPSLMVKKSLNDPLLDRYQRSSADKVYSASDIRTERACYDSMMYLLDNVLDFDINPKEGYHPDCQLATYFDIYSFLRDRTRAVRVDLHVQNLVHSQVFTDIHEWCLRFEILSIFRLWGRNFGEGADRKFNWQLSLNSIAQTIDPLTLSYVVQNDDREADDRTVAREAAIHRYIILILLCNGDTTRVLFYIDKLAKQQPEVFAHPNVRLALNVVNWFRVGQWSRVLQTYASTSTDFLTATALMPIAFLCRSRVLYDVVRTNRPFLLPKGEGHPARAPRPERVSLQSMQEMLFLEDPSMCAEFLQYHGCRVMDSTTNLDVDPSADELLSPQGIECLLPPRMLRLPYKWWLSSDDWVHQTHQEVPESWTWGLRKEFTERLGENVNADHTVMRCTFPQTVDPILARKYDQLLDSGVTLKDIVIGAIDPGLAGSFVMKPMRPAPPVRRSLPPPVRPTKAPQPLKEKIAVLMPNKATALPKANVTPFAATQPAGATPFGAVQPAGATPFGAAQSAGATPFGAAQSAGATAFGAAQSAGATPFGAIKPGGATPFGAVHPGAVTGKSPFGHVTALTPSSSPFGVSAKVASSGPFAKTASAFPTTTSGPFGAASKPASGSSTSPFGAVSGETVAAPSSSPFGAKNVATSKASVSPFQPVMSKAAAPPLTTGPFAATEGEKATSPAARLSPSRSSGAQSPRLAKKPTTEKVPIFEGLKPVVPPEAKAQVIPKIALISKDAKGPVEEHLVAAEELKAPASPLFAPTNIIKPTPADSARPVEPDEPSTSLFGASIFTSSTPSAPVEPTVAQAVLSKAPAPEPVTPQPSIEAVPRTTVAEMQQPFPAAPSLPVPPSIVRDECEVFSGDESELWSRRPRRKRRIEEPAQPTVGERRAILDDELMMADLPNGLVDRLDHISLQDDISSWIDHDSARRVEEERVEEARHMQEMNSYLVQNLLRKRRALMAWKQVFFSREQLRKLKDKCRGAKHRGEEHPRDYQERADHCLPNR